MAERLDIFVKNKLNISRQKASELIKNSSVTVNNKLVLKPSFLVDACDNIDIIDTDCVLKYVSRGGYKLEKALDCFDIGLDNKICIDIGASTGGFTDCMLQNGARKVYACDVGSNQLVDKLKNDDRVVSIENTDIRDLNIEDRADFISCDVSFISLKYILKSVYDMLSRDGEAVLLIKPQFEAGKAFINKNGIVKNSKVHIKVIRDIIQCAKEYKLGVKDLICSPIRGGDGNIEYLLYVSRENIAVQVDVEKVVREAFKNFK